MKIVNKFFTSFIELIKYMFAKKPVLPGDCGQCFEKDICASDKDKKYALIVGMETSKWGACPGSDKDSNTMLGMISQYVESNHIVKLNNGQGTVEAVRKALKEQIAKVPEDGLFIFTYSGHGGQTQKKTYSKDDPDGKDEFLCLYNGYILDDELWEIFNQCKGRIFVVFDCCHSGTMYRLANEEECGDEVEDRITLEKPFFAKYENVRAAIRMLVVSGCGEETVSWGDSVNGGVLTSSMKKTFNKCISYKKWWDTFRLDSSFTKVKQTPICTKIGDFDVNAKIFN